MKGKQVSTESLIVRILVFGFNGVQHPGAVWFLNGIQQKLMLLGFPQCLFSISFSRTFLTMLRIKNICEAYTKFEYIGNCWCPNQVNSFFKKVEPNNKDSSAISTNICPFLIHVFIKESKFGGQHWWNFHKKCKVLETFGSSLLGKTGELKICCHVSVHFPRYQDVLTTMQLKQKAEIN